MWFSVSKWVFINTIGSLHFCDNGSLEEYTEILEQPMLLSQWHIFIDIYTFYSKIAAAD